jgi:hypothetical protein
MKNLKKDNFIFNQVFFPKRLKSNKLFSRTFSLIEKNSILVGYHATSKENAERILEEGFKIQLSDEMFFGKGLYLSKTIEDAIITKRDGKKVEMMVLS